MKHYKSADNFYFDEIIHIFGIDIGYKSSDYDYCRKLFQTVENTVYIANLILLVFLVPFLLCD